VSLATHSGFAAPSHAASAVYGRRTDRNSLFLRKKSAGEISKMQRLFLAGRSTACRAKRRGLVQHFVLK